MNRKLFQNNGDYISVQSAESDVPYGVGGLRGLHIFLTFWLLAAALCFVGFYYAHNKGGDSLPPSVEAIVKEPIGILILLVVFLLLGPIPIAAIKIERKKPGEPNFKVDVTTKK